MCQVPIFLTGPHAPARYNYPYCFADEELRPMGSRNLPRCSERPGRARVKAEPGGFQEVMLFSTQHGSVVTDWSFPGTHKN